MINHRLRKAQLNGANIDVINSMAFDFNYSLNTQNIVPPADIVNTLAGVLKTLMDKNALEIPSYLDMVNITTEIERMATQLLDSEDSVIILGEHIANNPNAANIANLVNEIAKLTNSTTLNISLTANAKAAELVGFVPSNNGMNVNEMLETDMNAFVLLDVYPEYDFHHLDKAMSTLSKENTFVISLNSFNNDLVSNYADVMLPIASFYETSGTHVNINGDAQSFAATVAAPEESKPAWKVLKVLADLLELPGFHFTDSTQVLSEVSNQAHNTHEFSHDIDLSAENDQLSVIWQSSPYATDVLLRHSNSLQQTKIGCMNSASMNEKTAKSLSVKNGDEYLGVPVEITPLVADNCVFVSANQATNIGAQL